MKRADGFGRGASRLVSLDAGMVQLVKERVPLATEVCCCASLGVQVVLESLDLIVEHVSVSEVGHWVEGDCEEEGLQEGVIDRREVWECPVHEAEEASVSHGAPRSRSTSS